MRLKCSDKDLGFIWICQKWNLFRHASASKVLTFNYQQTSGAMHNFSVKWIIVVIKRLSGEHAAAWKRNRVETKEVKHTTSWNQMKWGKKPSRKRKKRESFAFYRGATEVSVLFNLTMKHLTLKLRVGYLYSRLAISFSLCFVHRAARKNASTEKIKEEKRSQITSQSNINLEIEKTPRSSAAWCARISPPVQAYHYEASAHHVSHKKL